MSYRYLFNTQGQYVAYVANDHVFDTRSKWLGFIVDGNEFYDKAGRFVGLITDDDRVVANPLHSRLPRLPPFEPFAPFSPIPPLRRLASLPLPGWIDVFATGNYRSPFQADRQRDLSQIAGLEGAKIIASDGQFLGVVSRNGHMKESIANRFGPYGSRFQQLSIWNKYGPYGSRYRPLSPFSRYSQTPPKLHLTNGSSMYLTVNPMRKPRIDPNELFEWINETKSHYA